MATWSGHETCWASLTEQIGQMLEQQRFLVGALLPMLTQRLRLDSAMTSAAFESRALSRSLVLRTWRGLLQGEDQLPDDWTGRLGVLVGRPATALRRR